MLLILFLNLAINSWGKSGCIYFVGDGNFFRPQVEARFIDQLEDVSSNWDDCISHDALISVGQKSTIYDPDRAEYTKFQKGYVQGDATLASLEKWTDLRIVKKKTVSSFKFFFGDHGSPEGVVTSDKVLTSADLRPLLKRISHQNIKVSAMFTHCYSGNMLDSFYDFESGETYGCGISAVNDTVAFIDRDLLTVGNVSKKAKFSQTARNSSKLNMNLLTSDRFLLDYNKKFANSGVRCDPVQQEDELFDILLSDASKLVVSTNELFEQTKKNMEAHPMEKNVIPGVGSPAEEVNYFLYKINLKFNESLKSDEDYQELVNQKNFLYEKLVECRDKKLAKTAPECKVFNKYQDLSNKLSKMRDIFLRKTKTKEILPARYSNMDDAPVSETLAFLYKYWNKRQEFELREARLKVLSDKKAALESMIKNKDYKAARMLRDLISCESQTEL